MILHYPPSTHLLLLLLLWTCICCYSFSTISEVKKETNANFNPVVKVISPNEKFRNTTNGELSILSFNMLAPQYHSLQIQDFNEREAFAEIDRKTRVPLAINMARSRNADILCLQEVEGGDAHGSKLKDMLMTYDEDNEGYDSFLWAPLIPNKDTNVVGLCVAWRKRKHRLVASDCYKRGMVVQMTEVDTGASFCIGNVHLPAKPASIMGRLQTMSNTIYKLSCLEPTKRECPLDGLIIVAGDFNCDQNSVTARLLTTGISPSGKIKDRNYKANIPYAKALKMRHNYRFRDVYSGALREYAPVTVSLRGRGPGCMDHIFFAQSQNSLKKSVSSDISYFLKNKNTNRRQLSKKMKGRKVSRSNPGNTINPHTAMRIESIMATLTNADDVNSNDLVRILKGLPAIKDGFPSDHLPVGAIFVENDNYKRYINNKLSIANESNKKSGLPMSVRRRRQVGVESMTIRRRHNAILRCTVDWLSTKGAEDIIRDQPLYKNKFTKGLANLKKKSRAPDLVCSLNNKLIIVEVTVSKSKQARKQKVRKYSDLMEILPSSLAIKEANLHVIQNPFIILLDEKGNIPHETLNDISELARLSSTCESEAKSDAESFQKDLLRVFSRIQN